MEDHKQKRTQSITFNFMLPQYTFLDFFLCATFITEILTQYLYKIHSAPSSTSFEHSAFTCVEQV